MFKKIQAALFLVLLTLLVNGCMSANDMHDVKIASGKALTIEGEISGLTSALRAPSDHQAPPADSGRYSFSVTDAAQAMNDYGNIGYDGPDPAAGSVRTYAFQLFALNVEPNIPAGANKMTILPIIMSNVIVGTNLTVFYQK